MKIIKSNTLPIGGKFTKKRVINIFCFLIGTTLLNACGWDCSFCIDPKNQAITSLNSKLRGFSINDPNGGGYLITVKDSIDPIFHTIIFKDATHLSISLKKIPKTYEIRMNGIRYDKDFVQLNANTTYTINRSGGDRKACEIIVKTDAKGNMIADDKCECRD